MKRLVKFVVGAALVLGLAAMVLVFVFGMRVEIGGTSWLPVVSFGPDAEEHYERLEAHRELQAGDALGESADEAVNGAKVALAPLANETYDVDVEGEAPVAIVEPATADSAAVARNVAPSWPTYRGVGFSGVVSQPVRTDWGKRPPEELWRQPIGDGYGSFVAADGRAFTLEQRRDQEVVAAYDVMSGAELWVDSWPNRFSESMGGDGPRSTPAVSGDTLYALGASGELRALDLETGTLRWRTNILEDAGASNIEWGMAASPLVQVGSSGAQEVVVLPGGAGHGMVAYDARTGQVSWKALNDRAAYVAPMRVELAGREQLLLVTAERLLGTTTRGELLWSTPWATQYDVNAAQPIVVDERHVFISSGYGKGAALVELLGDGKDLEAREVWFENTMKNKFSSSVLLDDVVYGLDEGILAAVEVRTGKRLWKGGRYGHGQVLLMRSAESGEHVLLVSTERGRLVLVRASPERHEELVSMDAVSGKTWNVPAVAGDGVLLVRNAREMVGFDLRP